MGKKAAIKFVQHEEKTEKTGEIIKMAFTDLTDCDNMNNAGIPCEYQAKYTRFRQKKAELVIIKEARLWQEK